MKKIFGLIALVLCALSFTSCLVSVEDRGVEVKNDSGFESGYVITDVYVSKDSSNRGEKVFKGRLDDGDRCYVNLEPGEYYVSVDFSDSNYVYASNWAGKCKVYGTGYVSVVLDEEGNLVLD